MLGSEQGFERRPESDVNNAMNATLAINVAPVVEEAMNNALVVEEAFKDDMNDPMNITRTIGPPSMW